MPRLGNAVHPNRVASADLLMETDDLLGPRGPFAPPFVTATLSDGPAQALFQ